MSAKNEVTINGGGGWIALVLWIIVCYGEPDLLDLFASIAKKGVE